MNEEKEFATDDEVKEFFEQQKDVVIEKPKRGRPAGSTGKKKRDEKTEEQQAKDFADSFDTLYSSTLEIIIDTWGKKKTPMSTLKRQLLDRNFSNVMRLSFPFLKDNQIIPAITALVSSTAIVLVPEFKSDKPIQQIDNEKHE